MSSDSSDEEVARSSSPSHKFKSCKIMLPKLQKPQSNPISIAKSESVEIRRRISYPEGVDLQQMRPRVSDDRPLSDDDRKYKRAGHPRKRSIYGASPNCNFGPKASIMKNSSSILTIPDPGIQRLTWSKPPVSVLVIKKVFDDAVFEPFRRLLRWLLQEKQMVVHVEESVLKEPQIQDNDDFNGLVDLLHTFKEGEDNLNDMIDFIICLGGDGTLLYASSLFQQSVPPVMAFHLGSLGFLTPFQFDDFRDQVTHVLEGHATLTLRSRLKCVMFKKDSEFINCDHINSMESKGGVKHQHTTVLNEVVIGRGQSAYLCNLDLYVEKRLITSVQGDGLIISTPTGSTAYACAAGASVVHPNVPAIVIVPICPHSLSFRPIVIPAGVEIKVMLSESARNTAWVSYDGRNRQELKRGDCVRITTSMYPVPSISFQDQINDWFNALAECLHWNVRKTQQGFNSSHSGPHESTISLDSMSLDSSDNNGHDA